MKYKVTNSWTVEVTEAEVRAVELARGGDVDPKQLAAFKAAQRTVEVILNEANWGNDVLVHFDVEEIVN